jgi:hypothetical protein
MKVSGHLHNPVILVPQNTPPALTEQEVQWLPSANLFFLWVATKAVLI